MTKFFYPTESFTAHGRVNFSLYKYFRHNEIFYSSYAYFTIMSYSISAILQKFFYDVGGWIFLYVDFRNIFSYCTLLYLRETYYIWKCWVLCSVTFYVLRFKSYLFLFLPNSLFQAIPLDNPTCSSNICFVKSDPRDNNISSFGSPGPSSIVPIEKIK